MLNNDWKNLADNVPEFTARASWSSDVDSQITFYKVILWPCIMLAGFGYAYYLLSVGSYVLSVLSVIATLVCLVSLSFLVDMLLNILIFGFVGGIALIALYIVGVIGYCIINAVNMKSTQDRAAIVQQE
jgi:hypothetical protein